MLVLLFGGVVPAQAQAQELEQVPVGAAAAGPAAPAEDEAVVPELVEFVVE